MPLLRGLLDRLLRRYACEARGASGVADVEGRPALDARAGAHVQEGDRRVLARLADARADRRGPPGAPRRRDPARARPRGARRARRGHVVSWYMARAEAAGAWEALTAPVPAPDAVVCVGGTGFERARRRVWPGTRVQRRLFHAVSQVKRYTISRPRLQAGREPCALAVELMHLDTLRQAGWWTERYLQRCGFWADFLEDVSYVDGRRVLAHERLRKARASLSRLVSQGTLFTYLDPALTAEGPLPRTNNAIEGGADAQLRDMLGNHRGMSLMRRVKAVFWWCRLHTGTPARRGRRSPRCRPTTTSASSTGPTRSARNARTVARSGATGPCGRSSFTGTRTPSGWTRTRVLSGQTFCPISTQVLQRGHVHQNGRGPLLLSV